MQLPFFYSSESRNPSILLRCGPLPVLHDNVQLTIGKRTAELGRKFVVIDSSRLCRPLGPNADRHQHQQDKTYTPCFALHLFPPPGEDTKEVKISCASVGPAFYRLK
jgi:hypothetical protein